MLITGTEGVDKKREIPSLSVWRIRKEIRIGGQRRKPNGNDEKRSAGYRPEIIRECAQISGCRQVCKSYEHLLKTRSIYGESWKKEEDKIVDNKI